MAIDKIDVFLSRKSQDAHLAKEIYDLLTKNGLKVFDSDHSLLEMGNADYSRAIDDALVKAEHLIVIGSSIENITSSWVEAEWRFFLNRKRAGKTKGNILTVITKTVKIDDLPASLQNYEVIPFDKKNERILPYVFSAKAKEKDVVEEQQKQEIEEPKPMIKIPKKEEEKGKTFKEQTELEYKEEKKNDSSVLYKIAGGLMAALILALIIGVLNGNKEPRNEESAIDSTAMMIDTVAALVDSAAIDTTATQPSINYTTLSDIELQQKAIDGDEKAQTYWGKRNYDKKDYSVAFTWYLKATEKRNASAQFMVGYMYKHGYGIKQNYDQAMQWYLKAAEQGDTDAKCEIGNLYDNGYGVKQDYYQAMQWYLKAAEKENSSAQNNIAVLYYKGLGVMQDKEIAKKWFLKAAKQGEETSKSTLKNEYGVTEY